MTRKIALRAIIAFLLLATAVGVVRAFQVSPTAIVLRFTSSPVRSTVEVLVHADTCCNEGTLSVEVVRPNGVTHTARSRISFPSGTTLHRVYVPYDIRGARFARVLN